MDLVFVLKVVKALAEVAGLALIGQGIVALFSGANRQQNFVYVLFQVVTGPPIRLARLISPRFIPDRHIPLVAFLLVFWIWVASVAGMIYLRTQA